MDITPEHMVREHGPRLRALAARLVGDGDDADEVMQRAWVAAWKAKPRSPGAWLTQVVRRIVGQLRRDEAALRERERQAARPEALPDTSSSLEHAEALEGLAAGLAALPHEWTEVVLLRYADGLPQREVADRLGIPVDTVRSRARRGLARLRAELERRGTDWRPALAILAVPSPREPAVAASLGVLLMSTKTIAALTLIAAAVVASSSALYLELSKPEPTSDIEAVSSSEPPHESRLSEARLSVLASPTDEQRIPQTVPSSNAIDASGEQGGAAHDPIPTRARLPDDYFEHLYTGYTLEQLMKELSEVRQQLQSDKAAGFKDRYERGVYDAKPPGYNAGRTGDQPFAQSRSDWRYPGESHIIELPFGEYSSLYDLADKTLWLHRTVSRLAKGK